MILAFASYFNNNILKNKLLLILGIIILLIGKIVSIVSPRVRPTIAVEEIEKFVNKNKKYQRIVFWTGS